MELMTGRPNVSSVADALQSLQRELSRTGAERQRLAHKSCRWCPLCASVGNRDASWLLRVMCVTLQGADAPCPTCAGGGFHVAEFIMGVLLGLAALVATALLAKQATSRHWQRRQTAVVMDTLKDLKREDVERLLKAVRQGAQCWEEVDMGAV